jgi:hypothetical protein
MGRRLSNCRKGSGQIIIGVVVEQFEEEKAI